MRHPLRMIPLLVAACLASSAFPSPARADAASDALYEKGNQAYVHGDYQGSIDAYEQVLATGVEHEDLHYNLANAYVKADRLGPAILHYEKALVLDPSRDDTQANLRLTREAAATRWQDKLQGAEHDPYWMRALSLLSPGAMTLVFLGVYAFTFLLAFAVYLLPAGFARVSMAVLLLFFAAGSLAAGGALTARWYLNTHVEQGIVLPDEIVVKEGPEGNTQTSFLIHAGLRVRIVEHDQDWLKIRLANGLEGWTRARDVGKL